MVSKEVRVDTQTPHGFRSCKPAAWVLAAGLMTATSAYSQSGIAGRGLSLSGGLSASVTSTASRSGAGQDSNDLISELRPSIFITSRSGRIVGSLSYSLSASYRQRESDSQNISNQLNAAFSAEVIERFAYVDVSSTVTQQTVSANGQLSAAGSTLDNNNRVEVGSLSISPYARGVFGSAVNYEVRLNAAGTNGRRSIAADSTTLGGGLSLSSVAAGTLIGWGFTANHAKQDFKAGRESSSDRYSASVIFRPDVDWSIDLRAGQESNDIANFVKTRYDNWGAGLTWRPSPRTRAQFQFDDRFFGRAHQILVEHRLASSSVQFSSSRDTGNTSAGGEQTITIYEAWNRLLAAQYPDPVERDAQIRILLGGTDPGQLVPGGGINSAVTVTERHQLVATYAGRRLSGSFQLFSSSSSLVEAAVASNVSKQWGYVSTGSYRLTPTASVNITGTRLLTAANGVNLGTELKSLSLGWSDQLARRTVASVNMRYSVFNSVANGYREAAVTASLSQRF